MEVLSVLLVLERPLPADRQNASLDLEVDLILLEAGELRGQDELFAVLFDFLGCCACGSGDHC